MATQLEQLSEKFRTEHLTRNSYNVKNLYDSNNKNAQSDGDEKGKGELDGQVGSLTDIHTRTELLARNRFNSGNLYGLGTPDAVSDGDERGKGENNGQVGSLSDINKRTELVASNKYGEKKRYPDF
jgi:hypothetical protein